MSKVHVSAVGFELTESLETHAKAKLASVIEKYGFALVSPVIVKLSLLNTKNSQTNVFSVSIRVSLKNIPEIFISEKSSDVYTLISVLAKKVRRTIPNNKAKPKRKRLKPSPSKHVNIIQSSSGNDEDEELFSKE